MVGVNGKRPPIVASERLLGAQLCFTRGSVGFKDVAVRHEQAREVCERIETLPLPLEAKASLVESTVIPKSLYDPCVTTMSKETMKSWGTRVCRTVWGSGRPTRCQELVLTLFSRGHACDPAQAKVCRTMQSTLRMLRRYDDQRLLFEANLHLRKTQRVHHGPTAQFLAALDACGWSYSASENCVILPGGDRHAVET